MSIRKIYCRVCECFVGTIRDASLMVGLEYICPTCSKSKEYHKEPDTDGYDSIFGHTFDESLEIFTSIFKEK